MLIVVLTGIGADEGCARPRSLPKRSSKPPSAASFSSPPVLRSYRRHHTFLQNVFQQSPVTGYHVSDKLPSNIDFLSSSTNPN